MRKLVFDTHEDLSEYMISVAKKGKCVEAIVYYEEAMNLIRDFAQFEDVEFESLVIEPYDYNRYDKEFYVYIASDMTLEVEKANIDGSYLMSEADVHLIDSDASSSILKSLLGGEQIEISIGTEEENEEENDILNKLNELFNEAKITKDNSGNITGIEIDSENLKFYFKKNFIDLF